MGKNLVEKILTQHLIPVSLNRKEIGIRIDQTIIRMPQVHGYLQFEL